MPHICNIHLLHTRKRTLMSAHSHHTHTPHTRTTNIQCIAANAGSLTALESDVAQSAVELISLTPRFWLSSRQHPYDLERPNSRTRRPPTCEAKWQKPCVRYQMHARNTAARSVLFGLHVTTLKFLPPAVRRWSTPAHEHTGPHHEHTGPHQCTSTLVHTSARAH